MYIRATKLFTMEYPLEYFDQLVTKEDKVTQKKYFCILEEKSLRNDIKSESLKIQKKLRQLYYSTKEPKVIDQFLQKIQTRLIIIKEKTEQQITENRSLYIGSPSFYSLTALENYQVLLDELLEIGKLFADEFRVSNPKLLNTHVRRILLGELTKDSFNLRNSISQGKELNYKLIDKYSLEEKNLYSILFKGEFSSGEVDPTYTCKPPLFLEYALEFKDNYLTPLMTDEPNFYFAIKDRIKKEFKRINKLSSISENEKQAKKLRFLEDFFLYTSRCPDITSRYFLDRMVYIQSCGTEQLLNYINELVTRLHKIKEEPKFADYHINRNDEPYEDVVDTILESLNYFKEKYKINPIVRDVQFRWNGTLKELYNWIKPFFKTKVTKDGDYYIELMGENTDENIVEALSKVFILPKEKGKSLKTSTLTTYFRNAKAQ